MQIRVAGSRRSLRNASRIALGRKSFTLRTSIGAPCLAFVPFDEGTGNDIGIYGALCAYPSDTSTDATYTTWTDDYCSVNHNNKTFTAAEAPPLGHATGRASNHMLYVGVQKAPPPTDYYAVFTDANSEQFVGLHNDGGTVKLRVVDGALVEESLTVTDTAAAVYAIMFDADENIVSFYVNGAITEVTPTNEMLLTGLSVLRLNDGASGTATFDVFGMALFHFNDFPEDWFSAVEWMGAQWQAGNKILWPQWSNDILENPPDRGEPPIVVVNLPPVANDATLLSQVNATTTGNFSATDPENATLTYAIVANGTLGTATVTNATTGAFSYVAGAVEGEDTVTFTAADSEYTSNTGTVTITVQAEPIVVPPNTPPTANNTAASVYTTETVTGFFAASDAENNPLTYRIHTNGALGTATLTNANTGAFGYVAGNTAGTDTVTFIANDGLLDSNIGQVQLTLTPRVVNPPGVIPSWYLNFTSNAAGGTFARTGTANYRPASYVLTSVAASTPRYHYPLSDRINRGIWIQPAMLDLTQAYGSSLTSDYWIASRSGATGTATCTVVGGYTGLDGGANTFRVTGTNTSTSAQRMMLSHTFDANEVGSLEANVQTVAYGTGSTEPTAGGLYRGATNGAIFELLSYTLTSGAWSGTAAGVLTIRLLSGNLASGENIHVLGGSTTMMATTGAAASGSNSAMIPLTVYAHVKRTSSSTWPWVSMRVRSELNTTHEVVFDLLRGTYKEAPTTSTIGKPHGAGIKYVKDGWFIIWMTYNVRASASSEKVLAQVGFGKPISFHTSAASATAVYRPEADDYVYFVTGTTPTGAWGRVAMDVSSGDTIVYFTETSGTINDGDGFVVSGQAPANECATVTVAGTNPYHNSYTVMFKNTVSGGSGTSLDLSAETFDIERIGAVRSHYPPMIPITNAVTDTTPNHVWVQFDAGDDSLANPVAGDTIVAGAASGTLLNAPYDASNANDLYYGTWAGTGTASGMLHINKSAGTYSDNVALTEGGNQFAVVNGAEAASSYKVTYGEKLTFNTTTGSYQLPTANFAMQFKFYQPCRDYDAPWQASHAYTSAGAEITPHIGEFEFRRNSSGTTGATEPTWLVNDGSTAMAAGDTKTDNTVTWTAYTPPEFYLWSSGTASIRKRRNAIRFYVDASNYVDWRVNDALLYYHQGTTANIAAGSIINGATITGAFSGATATLLANPALTSTGIWASGTATGTATGMLAIRPLTGTFIAREPLQISSSTFATCLGVAQAGEKGVLDEGDYSVGVKRTPTNGTELWVNGFLRCQKASSAAFTSTALPLGSTWYLGSDTNGVKQAGVMFYSIQAQSE